MMRALCPKFMRKPKVKKTDVRARREKAGEDTSPAGATEVPIFVVNSKIPSAPANVLWNSAAASVTGSSHERRGVGADDWFEVDRLGNAVAIVVADGMGSARFGAVGARLACKAVADTFRHRSISGKTDKQLLNIVREAVGEAQEVLEIVATELSCSGRDLATTLVCAIVTPDFVVAGQVGDCSCVVLKANGKAATMLSPQKGTYANETFALGVHEEVLKSSVFRGAIKGTACFSDGLESICMNRTEPYEPFLQPLFDHVAKGDHGANEDMTRLLQSTRVRNATDDDCTLVIAALAIKEGSND